MKLHNDVPIRIQGTISSFQPAVGEGWSMSGSPVTLRNTDETASDYSVAAYSVTIVEPQPTATPSAVGGVAGLLPGAEEGGAVTPWYALVLLPVALAAAYLLRRAVRA